MSRLGFRTQVVGGALGAALISVVGASSPASAAGGLQKCLNQAVDHNGEPPTCTKVDGKWVASWPEDGGLSGGGAGGAIAIILILGIVVTIAVIAWRVTTAQRLAREGGLDPRTATQMALLTDDGLDATYLASSLRRPPTSGATPGAPASVSRPVADRLTELGSLRDRGIITETEYDDRRRAILDEV